MSEHPTFTVTKVQDFAEIEQEFMQRVSQTVYCSVSTIDSQNRPRSRVLHPVWDGKTGWIGTFRNSPKSKHLARNPHLSMAYVADGWKPVYIECVAEWKDDIAERQWFWDWVQTVPYPMGYNPADAFTFDDTFGVLKLTPWRIEVYTLAVGTKIWQAE